MPRQVSSMGVSRRRVLAERFQWVSKRPRGLAARLQWGLAAGLPLVLAASWLLLLLACLLLVLTACDGGEPPATPPPAPAKPPEPPKPPEPDPPIVLDKVGFKKPESALHDAQADVYLVSNVSGKALEKNGRGFISKLSPEGKVLELRFIEGGKGRGKLHAPKGMALSGDELYVADIDSVRVFDRRSGKRLRSIKIKGATSLNDIAIGADGAAYVTDSGLEQWGPYIEPNGKDAIYRVEGKRATPVVEGKALGNPNGIAVAGAGLVVVNKRGQVLDVAADGARKERATAPKASLDGVVATPDGLLVSSWDGKAVYRLRADGGFDTVAAKLDAAADIGYDAKRKRLLVPQLTRDTLHIQPL